MLAWFAGLQAAHNTIVSGNESYRAGMYANSARTSQIANNYSIGAIRGQAGYSTNGGPNTLLPYYSPAGQVVNSGGNYYVQNAQGTYYQWSGNGWTQMNAQ